MTNNNLWFKRDKESEKYLIEQKILHKSLLTNSFSERELSLILTAVTEKYLEEDIFFDDYKFLRMKILNIINNRI